MSKYARIAELLKGFHKNSVVFFNAQVVSVEGATCTVKIDNLKLDDVRLQPTTTGADNKVLLIPAKDTHVLIGSFSGDYSNLFVIAADEYEKVEITCNGVNLMETVSDLIGALSGTLVLTTSVGTATGNFDPGTIAKLKKVETQFKQILK